MVRLSWNHGCACRHRDDRGPHRRPRSCLDPLGAIQIDSGPLDSTLRRARVCYDHLAGEFGVLIFDGLRQRGALRIAGKKVTLPRRAPWLADYVAELTSFPRGKQDDQVDAIAQALRWIGEEGMEPGILTYYRHLNEAAGRIDA